jgi:hypothetical protein
MCGTGAVFWHANLPTAAPAPAFSLDDLSVTAVD